MTNEQNKSIKVQTIKKREPVEFKSTIRLEGESGKEIAKVHNISAFSKITNKESFDVEMLVQGETNVYALYETMSGEFAEAKQVITWEERVMLLGATGLLVDSDVKKYEVLGVDSDSITVNLFNSLNIRELSMDEVSVSLDENLGLEKDVEILNITKVTCANNGMTLISEEFEQAGTNVSILSKSADVSVENSFAGVDTVTLSGNIFAKILLSVDGEMKMVSKTIPYKQEIECFGVNPSDIVEASSKVVKIMSGVREKTENSVDIVIDFEIDSAVISYAEEEVNVVKDAFSAARDTSLTLESVTVSNIKSVGYGNINVDFSASLEGKSGVDEIISVVSPKLLVSGSNVENSVFNIDGMVLVTIIYKNNNENEIQSFEASCPFVVSGDIQDGYNNINNFKFNINNFKLKAGNEIQFDADIYYSLLNTQTEQVNYVSNIDFSEKQDDDTSAIRVYTVKEGEKIFDIAKNLGVTISNLISQNPDLESGVVAGEKVYVYVPLVINF